MMHIKYIQHRADYSVYFQQSACPTLRCLCSVCCLARERKQNHFVKLTFKESNCGDFWENCKVVEYFEELASCVPQCLCLGKQNKTLNGSPHLARQPSYQPYLQPPGMETSIYLVSIRICVKWSENSEDMEVLGRSSSAPLLSYGIVGKGRKTSPIAYPHCLWWVGELSLRSGEQENWHCMSPRQHSRADLLGGGYR